MRALGNKGTWPGDIKRLCSSFFLSYHQAAALELTLLLGSFDGRRHYEFDAFAVDSGFLTWDLPIQRFKVSNDETATAFVARFDALTTKLKGKSTSIIFPDIYRQQRFLRALPKQSLPGTGGASPRSWAITTELIFSIWLNCRRQLSTKRKHS
jgi:hypothetical protein